MLFGFMNVAAANVKNLNFKNNTIKKCLNAQKCVSRHSTGADDGT